VCSRLGVGREQRLVPSVAESSLPLSREHFPRLSHFEELIALLAALHLLGERAAIFGVLEVFVSFLHGRCPFSSGLGCG
jgi:hypothetical protein